ncbi:MAG: transglutaminase family protein [Alphaproteobacteria bacterium]
MLVRFGFEISLQCTMPVPMTLALSPHSGFRARRIGSDRVQSEPQILVNEYIDAFGNRMSRIVAPPGMLTLWSDCAVESDGLPDPVIPEARQLPVEQLPPETLVYLRASRYCESDALVGRAWNIFGNTPEGWPRVQAICDFVHNHVTFGYQFGRPTKTAQEVFVEKSGVCRDFAHLSIALCRAMNIPARYASGYLGDIGVPPAGAGDFCAWFEAFLDGEWHTFDARYNTPRIGRVLMTRGYDAADVAMITSFGNYALTAFRVWCEEIPQHLDDNSVNCLLKMRPAADIPAIIPARVG